MHQTPFVHCARGSHHQIFIVVHARYRSSDDDAEELSGVIPRVVVSRMLFSCFHDDVQFALPDGFWGLRFIRRYVIRVDDQVWPMMEDPEALRPEGGGFGMSV